jgi:hypothetical protein
MLLRVQDGCIIYGLFLEGARWDPVIKGLNDSIPKQLYTDVCLRATHHVAVGLGLCW